MEYSIRMDDEEAAILRRDVSYDDENTIVISVLVIMRVPRLPQYCTVVYFLVFIDQLIPLKNNSHSHDRFIQFFMQTVTGSLPKGVVVARKVKLLMRDQNQSTAQLKINFPIAIESKDFDELITR